MMSDPTTVDRTTVDELTGKLVLLIEESRAWDEPTLMHRQLAAKVKNYVRHVRSDEYGRPPSETIVRLVSEHRPSPASIDFFGRVSYELGKHGLSFEYQVGAEGLPVPIAPEAGTGAAPKSTSTTPTPRRREAGPVGTDSPASPPSAPAEPAERPSPQNTETEDAEELSEATVEPARPQPEEPPEPSFETAETETAAGNAETWTPDALREEEEEEDLEFEASPSGTIDRAELPELDVEVDAPSPDTTDQPDVPEPGLESVPADSMESHSEEEVEELVTRLESLARPPAERPQYPPYFPEEEFGRAVPEGEIGAGESEDLDLEEPEFETPVIETGSGKQIRLEAPAPEVAKARPREARPGLLRALGSSLGSALVGATVWGLLAIPADQGASPLAVALAVMVGMSVRLQGGSSLAFRIVAGVATFLGSILGAVLAATTLTAKHGGGISALPALAEPGVLIDAVMTYFGLLDLAFVAVAVYIAVRISVAKR